MADIDKGHLIAATCRGLRRSEDSRATWNPVPGVLDGNTISAIFKHPTRSGVFFASRYGGVFASADDGQTWVPVTSPDHPPAVRELLVVPGTPDTLYAITRFQVILAIALNPGLL